MLSTLFVGATTLLIIVELVRDYRRLQKRPRLDSSSLSLSYKPVVSLLIPARNEEHTIARCLAGALAQDYENLEVFVLDDGSSDATPAILAPYAADGQVHVLHGAPLPPGWVGKCYACQQLALAARGEWLLFIDADTVPRPALTSALLATAYHKDFDLLSIWPFLELGSFWERAVLPPFYNLIAAVFPARRIMDADARPDEVMANGQCMLVRRSAYLAIGGHDGVRAEILEDVRLAQRLRAAGYRIGIAYGSEFMHVRMYTSRGELIEGLTKNAVAGSRSGGLRAFWEAARLALPIVAPLWLIAGGVSAWRQGRRRSGMALLLQGSLTAGAAFQYWSVLLSTLYRFPRSQALLYPFGLAVYLFIAVRAMWLVHRGRGVSWKGRRYDG